MTELRKRMIEVFNSMGYQSGLKKPTFEQSANWLITTTNLRT
ncbi:MAG: hypothetical protein WAV20_16285 [Blastocatellia bacterium]